MNRFIALLLAGGLTVSAAVPTLTMAAPAKPAAAPAPAAVEPPPVPRAKATPEEKTKTLFDYLLKHYKGMLVKSKDRLARSLVVVCVARIPRADATAELLNMLKTERDPLVQMVCWQAILARAGGLTDAEFKQWSDATKPLMGTNYFRGDLRASLLKFLALSPPDSKGRELAGRYFAECNSTDPRDYKTLIALGETIKAWGDPALLEAVMSRLSDINDAQRAEIVIQAAGASDVSYAATRQRLGSVEMWKQATKDYTTWWSDAKTKWKPRGATEPGEWKKLESQYIPKVDMAATVDPDDKQWYKDLELRSPNLRVFSVGLVVDATGSMGQVLVWLRSDVKRMMESFKFVALEPQISLTFYRDAGDAFFAKTVPLSGNLSALSAALATMDAKGGGDIPESVREGLRDALTVSAWSASPKQPKALVLIGDAPPHAQTQAECEKMVKDAMAKGFRTYAVKVTTGYEASDLDAFDKIAAAGGGSTISADMRTDPGLKGNRGPNADAIWRMTQGSSEEVEPGEEVVTRVLIDAINPQFADRVRPPVGILWQMLKEQAKETHQPFPAAAPPVAMDRNRGDNPNRPKGPPQPAFDPQKQK